MTNIPTSEDSWLVMGPGRSGSKVIVDILCNLYLEDNLKLKIHSPEREIENVDKLTIYHSHSLNDFDFENKITRCILSIRDIIDSSLSWCIRPHIGEWHLYPHKHTEIRERLEKSIPSFYLDPEIFLTYYNQVVYFYNKISDRDLSNFTIIDYSEFRNDQYEILRRLDYCNKFPITRLPAKNPGTYEQWIVNWDEIKELSLTLERDPQQICNKLRKDNE